jgi:transcriptional regulator GlxA family with amidase domain
MKEDMLYGNEIASSLLYSLIIEMNRMYSNVTNKYDQINCSPINKALKFIDENYWDKITMDELCEIANLSESQLCRLFQKHLNMRPMEYVFQIRVKSAKELLIQTDLSILEISQKVGYENPTYFSMLFRKNVGISPSEFRKIMV